jgi:hypothetical protein
MELQRRSLHANDHHEPQRTSNPAGRGPAAAGLDGEIEFDVEVTERGSVTLRPVVVIPRDDAWAYTAEHLADVAKALTDIREGRVRRLSDDDLAAYDD